MEITKKLSPNYSAGRGGKKIDRIVIHWIVGNLAAADATFSRPASQVSAHYGVENNTVHQYVEDNNTAWHAGSYDMNQRSIGIEHSADPSRPPSAQTNETSAQLVASLCKKHGIPCDRAHIIKHSQVVATQCCGSVPIDAIVARANQILKGGKAPVAKPTPTPAPAQGHTIINWNGTVTTNATVNVRSVPTTKGNQPLRTNPKGQNITIVGYTYGEDTYKNGNSIWLKAHTGAFVKADGTNFKLASQPKTKPSSGVAVVKTPVLNVRKEANTSSPLAGSQVLKAGDSFVFIGVVKGQKVTQYGVTSDKWLVSQYGNKVWSGGTNQVR